MTNMRIVCVLNVRKVAYEMSGRFAEVRAPQADNDSSNHPEMYHENVFLAKSFDWNTLFRFRKFYV